MHELGIAQDIVRQVEDETRRLGVGRVAAVHIRLGPRAFATRDSLTYCLQASSEGTVAEGATVCIKEADGGGIVLEAIDVEE